MAKAEIYMKWSCQGAWSGPFGTGVATNQGNIIALNQHAERIAWRAAWPVKFRNFIRDSQENFIGDTFQVKIWVDQQICPTCQKWITVDVVSHLKLLSKDFSGTKKLTIELYAEVQSVGVTRSVKVGRQTVWPKEVGNITLYKDLPSQYS